MSNPKRMTETERDTIATSLLSKMDLDERASCLVKSLKAQREPIPTFLLTQSLLNLVGTVAGLSEKPERVHVTEQLRRMADEIEQTYLPHKSNR